jgi:hypothetical protein
MIAHGDRRCNIFLPNPGRSRAVSSQKIIRFAWVAEPFAEDPTHLERAMFGCRAHYLDGRLVLVRADRGAEPWQGLLFPTERPYQSALVQDFPALRAHPVLGKWLYLPEASSEFDETARSLGERIRARDPRLGVEPAGKRSEAPPRPGVTRRGASARRR